MSNEDNSWEKCSICKKSIPFGAKYFQCSVSTCKHPRTGMRFCSSDCWDAHLPLARHREAWAEEAVAPRGGIRPAPPTPAAPPARAPASADEPRAPVRRIVESRPPQSFSSHPASPSGAPTAAPQLPSDLDTLVVVSKVKQLIRDSSDYSTSQCCIDALTKKVAEAAMKGIEAARAAGRKTVMGRDIR